MGAPLNVDWGAIKGLALGGMPLRELARRFNINPSTVLLRSKREAWGILQLHGRSPKRQITRKEVDPEIKKAQTKAAVQVVSDFFRQAGDETKNNLAKASVAASDTLAKMSGPEIVENHNAFQGITKAASSVFGWGDEDPCRRPGAINIALMNTSPAELARLCREQEQIKANAREIET